MPAKPRAATRSFCAVVSDARPVMMISGFAAIFVSSTCRGARRGLQKAAPIQCRQQPQASVIPTPGPSCLVANQLGQPPILRVEVSLRSGLQFDAEQCEVGARQVDPPVLEVFADIAEDVRQLQRDAQGVRDIGGLGVVAIWAEHAQRQPADRARYAAAVVDELVQRLVGAPLNVHLASVDELAEGVERNRQPFGRVVQGHEDSVVRVLGRGQRCGSGFAEQFQLSFGRE